MSFTVAQIRKRVDEILKSNRVTNPEVDVERIARSLGADVRGEELDDDMSGLLSINHGKPTIAFNKDHSENRRRFTIAHELGHLVLHSEDTDRGGVFIDRKVFHRNSQASQGIYRQEIEANRFAAELLMPKKMLLTAIEEFGDDIDLSDDDTISKLADIFGVSTQALTIRLASLDMAPSI